MSDFSFWDIVRNLLTGLQWTLLLSLVAFIGGGVIGLLVMTMRISSKVHCRPVARLRTMSQNEKSLIGYSSSRSGGRSS